MFDDTSDPDCGKLYQTRVQLGDKQLKPSESKYKILEGNLLWIYSQLNTRVCVPRKYQAAILHEFPPLGSHAKLGQTRLMLP